MFMFIVHVRIHSFECVSGASCDVLQTYKIFIYIFIYRNKIDYFSSVDIRIYYDVTHAIDVNINQSISV